VATEQGGKQQHGSVVFDRGCCACGFGPYSRQHTVAVATVTHAVPAAIAQQQQQLLAQWQHSRTADSSVQGQARRSAAATVFNGSVRLREADLAAYGPCDWAMDGIGLGALCDDGWACCVA
jgi:hypothetical protein